MSNKYTYSVPFTEEELCRDYVQLRLSQDEVAKKYGTTQKVVWRAMKKMGIPTRKAAKREQRGNLNSSWKGGRVLMAKDPKDSTEHSEFGNGYYYLRDPEHPNANRSGYVAEHIVVATTERGHPLSGDELVHHINLDKHDNDPRNLLICDTARHGQLHAQLQEIAASLIRDGLVIFDAQTGYRRSHK